MAFLLCQSWLWYAELCWFKMPLLFGLTRKNNQIRRPFVDNKFKFSSFITTEALLARKASSSVSNNRELYTPEPSCVRFCYGFPGAKTFRDLEETGPLWTNLVRPCD